MKKTILFVADKPDWAYEYMIKAWLSFLLQDYDCFIIFSEDYAVKKSTLKNGLYRNIFNLKSYFKLIILKLKGEDKPAYFISKNFKYYYPKYPKNKLYQFQKDLGKKISDKQHFDIKIEMAFYFQYIAELPFSANKNIVGIFTDKFPHDGPNWDLKKDNDRNILSRTDFYNEYLKSYDQIIVGGGNLLNDYRKLTDKVDFVYGIYGQENFVENKNVGLNDELTFGWTGTPDRPMKGFRTIIEPAIENVRKTGRDIRLKTKFSGPYEELYSFYTDVDCIIIASDADSGPSMYAEACLSGVPCISTKVGLPLMGIKNNENGFLIKRELETLENKIIEIYDNRLLLKSMANKVKSDYLKLMDNALTFQNLKKVLEN